VKEDRNLSGVIWERRMKRFSVRGNCIFATFDGFQRSSMDTFTTALAEIVFYLEKCHGDAYLPTAVKKVIHESSAAVENDRRDLLLF